MSRFTHPEQLPAKEYTCGFCGDSTHGASKQLSIQKLPPVLCIQLKVRPLLVWCLWASLTLRSFALSPIYQRFEHVGGSHKVDTPIRYPLKLNLRKYVSATLAKPSPEVGVLG